MCTHIEHQLLSHLSISCHILMHTYRSTNRTQTFSHHFVLYFVLMHAGIHVEYEPHSIIFKPLCVIFCSHACRYTCQIQTAHQRFHKDFIIYIYIYIYCFLHIGTHRLVFAFTCQRTHPLLGWILVFPWHTNARINLLKKICIFFAMKNKYAQHRARDICIWGDLCIRFAYKRTHQWFEECVHLLCTHVQAPIFGGEFSCSL
jgi:hypothetical protein